MIRNSIFFCLLICFAVTAASQKDTHTRIFDSTFHSLKISPEGQPVDNAVTFLGEHSIAITIDEWAEEPSYLEARLVHLNADWTPSSLLESEFIEGFNSSKIEDWALSDNTFRHYVNYKLRIPDSYLKPSHSGNYLIEIYREEEPDSLVAQARFSLSEAITPIKAEMCIPTDKGTDHRWQQLKVEADVKQLKITDPFSELILTIEQNGSPIGQHILLHPSRINGDLVIFEHQPELIFDAGNEFRRFETVVADYAGRGIDSVRFENNSYQAYLRRDFPKEGEQYSFDMTQFGSNVVKARNATDSDLGADYITTHFLLDAPQGKLIFLEGEFTRSAQGGMIRMEGNGPYHISLPLKQGEYNYRYFERLADGSYKNIDGSHRETRNRYIVKLFHRPPGSRGDRLVGFNEIIANE